MHLYSVKVGGVHEVAVADIRRELADVEAMDLVSINDGLKNKGPVLMGCRPKGRRCRENVKPDSVREFLISAVSWQTGRIV